MLFIKRSYFCYAVYSDFNLQNIILYYVAALTEDCIANFVWTIWVMWLNK
jgi:hypothetical protein